VCSYSALLLSYAPFFAGKNRVFSFIYHSF
jgi:hypothetical protein